MLQIIALTGELSHRVNLEIGDFDRSTEIEHRIKLHLLQQSICSERIHPLSIFPEIDFVG